MTASKENEPFIHPSAIIDQPCQIGSGTKIWHFSHIMSGCQIGDGCSLGQNCFVASGVVIGQNVKIQNNVSLYEGVELEDDVFCGPSMVFTNVLNPRSQIVRKGEYRPTVVRRGTTIGANATIVCGHEIGEYAFIGAGAVITGDVAPYALMLGVPARHCGWMSRCGQRLEFDRDGLASCPESGEQYVLSSDGVVSLTDQPRARPENHNQQVVSTKENLTATKADVRSNIRFNRAPDDHWRDRLSRQSISKVLLVVSSAYYLILCWLLMSPSPLADLPDDFHRVLSALDLEDYAHFCLFFPLGVLAASRWVCSGRWWDALAAICFATGSEVVQVFMRSRDAQVTDLFQNVAGLVLGAATVGISLSFLLVSKGNFSQHSFASDETRV